MPANFAEIRTGALHLGQRAIGFRNEAFVPALAVEAYGIGH